jgi:hypothetical protein
MVGQFRLDDSREAILPPLSRAGPRISPVRPTLQPM